MYGSTHASMKPEAAHASNDMHTDKPEVATAPQTALNPLWVINIGMGIFFCMAAALLARG